jgi:hypothetical protein
LGNFLLEIFYNFRLQPFTIRELFYFLIVPQQHSSQRFAACRSGELRDRLFSAEIKFLAKDKCEFTTYFAIFANRC